MQNYCGCTSKWTSETRRSPTRLPAGIGHDVAFVPRATELQAQGIAEASSQPHRVVCRLKIEEERTHLCGAGIERGELRHALCICARRMGMGALTNPDIQLRRRPAGGRIGGLDMHTRVLCNANSGSGQPAAPRCTGDPGRAPAPHPNSVSV